MQHRVIVTGASKGIGAAIAKRYLSTGAEVLICARNLTHLEEFKKECAHLQGELHIFQCDMSKEEDVHAFAKHAVSVFPNGCTALINNAGFFAPGSFSDIDIASFQTLLQTNF